MKRRDFLKTSAAAAGLMSSLVIDPALAVAEGEPQESKEPFLPEPPASASPHSISPMPFSERVNRKIVPKRGFCSLAPGKLVSESLISGNGTMIIELMGDPYAEQILFHHESLLMPWERPLEAPKIADIFPQVRKMVLAGKDREAMMLALQHMNESSIKQDTEPHLTVPAFLMQVEIPKTDSARDYLRTLDFDTGEVKVYWTDEHGEWVRQAFVSRPENAVVQQLIAPAGHSVNLRISLQKSAAWSMFSGMDWGSHLGINATAPDRVAFAPSPLDPKPAKGVEANEVRLDLTEQRLVYQCILDPAVDNSGYIGVVRVVRNGGSARIDGKTLAIENATSVVLLTRIEYFSDVNGEKADPLYQALEELTTDYQMLLDRHRKLQSEMLNRVTVDFGGDSQYGLSAEELLSDQRSRPDYSPALLEKIFEMGRHWFILNSGKYPSIAAEVNTTIDLQTAAAVQGDLHEGMDAYFNWMESLAADCRINAQNIFGCRGASYPLFPDKGFGVNFYYTGSSGIGIWPYWISAGGLCLRRFWEHYLVTGDEDFLRNRVVPAYKQLALFYEDFLAATDDHGNYIFVPSISPENVPRNRKPSGPGLVNATMDIAVCREVLCNLIQASQILDGDGDSVTKWRAMLAKMPPYLLENDGTLKEWAWPTMEEHYNHRHISHLYGVWPGDEIDPDRTPELARAALLADRRRTFDTLATAVAGETLPAFTRCHRALVGARLKDSTIVDVQLRQLMEQGYVSTALRCSREPYGVPVPDAHGGIPALLMEMLVYSRPGVIEVLPALPQSLRRGSIKGMLLRTFARLEKLAWDLDARSVDLTISSVREQNVTLLARQGIEEINAPAGVLAAEAQSGGADRFLHLPKGKAVEIHLKLGPDQPLDWVGQATTM